MRRSPAPTPDRSPDAPKERPALQTLTGMFAGGALLATMLIVSQTKWTFTLIDAGFWIAVVGVVALRYLATPKAAPPEGQKMPWPRFALGLVVAACAVWLAAQAVGAEPIE